MSRDKFIKVNWDHMSTWVYWNNFRKTVPKSLQIYQTTERLQVPQLDPIKRRTSNAIKATPLVYTWRVWQSRSSQNLQPSLGSAIDTVLSNYHLPMHPLTRLDLLCDHLLICLSIVFLVLHIFLLLDLAWGLKHRVCRFKRKQTNQYYCYISISWFLSQILEYVRFETFILGMLTLDRAGDIPNVKKILKHDYSKHFSKSYSVCTSGQVAYTTGVCFLTDLEGWGSRSR